MEFHARKSYRSVNNVFYKIRNESSLLSKKKKERFRQNLNFNFHPSLDDKVQRFINCMEPGTKVEIHHHPVDDDKDNIEEKVIRPADGVYTSTGSAQVLYSSPRRVVLQQTQHSRPIECLEPDTCVFEVKEGPFVSHKDGGILE